MDVNKKFNVMAKFKEGEVVYLASGGPRMTVLEVKEEDSVVKYVCIWFDNNEQQKKETYPEAVLRKPKPLGIRRGTI